MAQPSVACYFNNRKRTTVQDIKINQARKVLLLDTEKTSSVDGLEKTSYIISSNISEAPEKNDNTINIFDKLQGKEEKLTTTRNKIVTQNVINSGKPKARKMVRSTRTRKPKELSNQKCIDEIFSNMKTTNFVEKPLEKQDELTDLIRDKAVVLTPPSTPVKNAYKSPASTPTKNTNPMDKVIKNGPTLNEIKRKMSRSSRLAELKASLSRFKESSKKLDEIEKKTADIGSPKLKTFKSIELEVPISPQKSVSPEKPYLSPRKEVPARRNLSNALSPVKKVLGFSAENLSKQILDTLEGKPALTLPFKYRYVAEIFRAIDTVSQILYNRKETITFKKLKPAVEEMLKRNLTLKHIAQIKQIYPDAFIYEQEKLRVFGTGQRQEEWELVIKPNTENSEHLTPEVLLERRRKVFNTLIDRVKDYHDEFLKSLEPPMNISKDKITRWHPEFDIEKVPDIEEAELPQPPHEEKFTTGKDVLEKARQMFNCNIRMEQALERLKTAKETDLNTIEEKPKEVQSVLKGIPKALLEKVRQKQAAKALVSMTRSADEDNEILMYSRLPEIARLTRNIFVTEKKSVLPLETVIDKLGNCYRCFLSKSEMEKHLKIIAEEIKGWLVFHDIRNTIYLKLLKNGDLSVVVNKLEDLLKKKSQP